jgi:hypothetical protein
MTGRVKPAWELEQKMRVTIRRQCTGGGARLTAPALRQLPPYRLARVSRTCPATSARPTAPRGRATSQRTFTQQEQPSV